MVEFKALPQEVLLCKENIRSLDELIPKIIGNTTVLQTVFKKNHINLRLRNVSALYCIKNQNPNTIHKFLTAYLQIQLEILPKITG